MAASYPNFAGKHAEEAIVTPADFTAYLRAAGGLADCQSLDGVIFCYQRSLYDYILRAEGVASADAFAAAGVPFRTGTSWTIDPPYRETVAEARHYQVEGVLCAEMEAAALAALRALTGGPAGSPPDSPSRPVAFTGMEPAGDQRPE